MMKLKVSRRYPAPIDEVFAAWTDTGSMADWMNVEPGPAHSVELDVRVGGKFRICMGRGRPEHEITGRYLEIEPPRLLKFTWRGSFPAPRDSIVTVRLAPAGREATDLDLVHEELPSAEAAKAHQAGWKTILARLADRWSTEGRTP